MAARSRSRKAARSRLGLAGWEVASKRNCFAGKRKIGLLRLAQEVLAAPPGSFEELRALGLTLRVLTANGQVRGCSARSAKRRTNAGSSSAQRIVRRLQLQIHQRVFQAGHAAAVELVAEPVPGLLGGRIKLAPIEKDVALVGVQIESESARPNRSPGAGIPGRSASRARPEQRRSCRSGPALPGFFAGAVGWRPCRRRPRNNQSSRASGRSGCCKPPGRARRRCGWSRQRRFRPPCHCP
jgi:hypothetical protein